MSEKHSGHLPGLGVLGLILTFLYVGSIFIYLHFGEREGLSELTKLALNELGDFLAGVFGPLAIFWLVLGFFQQSRELRLQVKELSLSVDQQKELVEVTRETLLYETDIRSTDEKRRQKKLQPIFKFVFEGGSRPFGSTSQTILPTLQVTNVGETVFDVNAKFDFKGHSWGRRDVATWAKDSIESFPGNTVVEGKSFRTKMYISFKDADGKRGEKSFTISDGGMLVNDFSAHEET